MLSLLCRINFWQVCYYVNFVTLIPVNITLKQSLASIMYFGTNVFIRQLGAELSNINTVAGTVNVSKVYKYLIPGNVAQKEIDLWYSNLCFLIPTYTSISKS